MRSPIAVLFVVLAPLATSAADPVLGQRVFVKEGAVAKVGNVVVSSKLIPYIATVEAVDGDFLWLGRVWVRNSDVMSTQEAVKDLTEAILLDPKDATAFCNRGAAWAKKGEIDNAIKDLTDAIRLDPNDAMAYCNRGAAWAKKNEFDNSIEDLTEAIRLNPKYAMAYGNRGAAWAKKNEIIAALKDCKEAIRLNPKDASAYSNVAWLKATSTDDRYRDGTVAVEYALRACELTASQDWYASAALAAAYAETGNFTDAVQWAEKTIELAPASEKPVAEHLLKLYRANKPCREPLKQIVRIGEVRLL